MQNIELRDWFAGRALPAVIGGRWRSGEETAIFTRECAGFSYAFADAMLAARGPAKPPAPQLSEKERAMIMSTLRQEALAYASADEATTARGYHDLAAKFAEPESAKSPAPNEPHPERMIQHHFVTRAQCAICGNAREYHAT